MYSSLSLCFKYLHTSNYEILIVTTYFLVGWDLFFQYAFVQGNPAGILSDLMSTSDGLTSNCAGSGWCTGCSGFHGNLFLYTTLRAFLDFYDKRAGGFFFILLVIF